MKRYFFTLLFVFLVSLTHAQKGFLRGTIIDATTGEPLIGATVAVKGTTTGTISDFDGNYNLPLDAGTYDIQISYISYETQNFPGVTIDAGEVEIINANLGEATTELNEVVVTAEARQRTEAAIQVMQRKSAVVLDGISSQQISRMGDSDAAGALKRVTGVSVQGGKYVYVRGLSERYIKITVNGASIPGLDPDINTVQMDLFPSNIVESIIVNKTWSPNMPVFTGGYVDIITKDFPNKFTLRASASLGFTPGVNLNNNFHTYPGGETDWLGMDDGTRSLPDEINRDLEWERFFTPNEDIEKYSKSFSKNITNTTKTSFLNQSYLFSVGNQYQIFNNQSIGVIASISYKNDYAQYLDGKYGRYDSYPVNKRFDLAEDYGNQEVIWTALAGLSYKPSANHKISFNYIKNQGGAAGSRYRIGPNPEQTVNVQHRFLEYVERSMNAFQLSGKHNFSNLGDVQVEWISSYTLSTQDEPDMRFWFNDYRITENGDTTYSIRPINDPLERNFRFMEEINFDNNLHVNIPFENLLKGGSLSFGGNILMKDRTSDEYRYTLKQARGAFPYSNNPVDFVVDERFNILPRQAYLFYDTDMPTNHFVSYIGTEDILGLYAMADIKLTEKIRMLGGVKFEKTDVFIENGIQNDSADWVNYYDPTYRTFDQINRLYNNGSYAVEDVLPSLNLTYSLSEQMNLRASYYKTLSRPAFREIAPYSYYDFQRGDRFVGNPELLRSLANNFDLRWEYFARPGELISLSGFYKKLFDPIEVYSREESENPEYNYRNGNDGDVYGAELELRKQLDFLQVTKDFMIGVNFTYIYSEVQENEDRVEFARENDPGFEEIRPMYGQAPYVLNSYLIYENKELGFDGNISFNVSGKKLIIIEKGSTPNVYEMPYPDLRFGISKAIGENFSIDFEIKNILNPNKSIAYVHHSGETYDFLSFKEGREFSIGLKYSIR